MPPNLEKKQIEIDNLRQKGKLMIKEQQLKKRLLSSNRVLEDPSEDDPEVSARIKIIEKGKKGFT